MNPESKMLQIGFIVLIIVVLAFGLTGCTTTKTVEVPVPVPCAKPKNLPVPHNYMADLNEQSNPPEFVKACLATTESCFNAYNACAIYHRE